jgi:hypothetical protein
VSDQRGRLLVAALGFAGLPRPSYDRALWALRFWLDSWRGIGDVERGMAHQGYDLQLTRYDARGLRRSQSLEPANSRGRCSLQIARWRESAMNLSGAAGTLSLALSSVLVVTACVAPTLSPPRPRVAEISRLVVVAVEPPPLLVTDIAARDSASIFLTAVPVAVVSPVAGAALVLLGTVVMSATLKTVFVKTARPLVAAGLKELGRSGD